MTQTKFKKFPFNLELAKKITNECYEEFIKELDAASTATTKKRTTMTQTTMEAIQPKTEIQFKKVPFNIELAKKITNNEMKGRIVTRNGRQARIICFDLKNPAWGIIALVLNNINSEDVLEYQNNGCYSTNIGWHELDLLLEVPTYYKDYSNFVPCKWQPCLVRYRVDDFWIVRVCNGEIDNDKPVFYAARFNATYDYVLPLSKITERLIGTNKSYEELIKELDAELTTTTKNEQQ